MATFPSFCIAVPMYNEEQGAETCVRTLSHALSSYPEGTTLLVVNDGSADATGSILSRLSRELGNLTVVTNPKNLGYGGAIRTAIRKAAEIGCDYVLFMDSDLTNDPKYIGPFVDMMREGVDLIKASRYVKGGRAIGVPLYRVCISVVGNAVARLMFGLPLSDCTNGFLAWKVSILKQMPLEESGFAILMEQLYYARHCATTFAEVPYTLTARTETVRRSSFHYRPKVFWLYFKHPLMSALRISPKPLLAPMEESNAADNLSRL